MDFFDPKLTFDPQKPFYGLVVAYVAQVHGLLDLVSRGLREEWEKLRGRHQNSRLSSLEMEKMLSDGIREGYRDHIQAVLRSQSAPIIGVQRLVSRLREGVKVDTVRLANEIFSKHQYPVETYNKMTAGALLIVSWEVTKSDHSQDPLWEFHRHCRNAAAHNGNFNFQHGEPKRPAKWGALEIVLTLQDTPIFPNSSGRGFIGPGDVLYLLADIEAKFY
ncbi:MAG: hypothetical protein RDU59_10645 [Thermodesulfobacteriota bacterium]|nr:hypothetical protein [Thermodesulfobacteriota bacterium]